MGSISRIADRNTASSSPGRVDTIIAVVEICLLSDIPGGGGPAGAGAYSLSETVPSYSVVM